MGGDSGLLGSISWENESTYLNAESQLTAMIMRDRNRANVIIWSMANETPSKPARNKFLGKLAAHARLLDPTRLISAALEQNNYQGNPTIKTIDDPFADVVDVLSFNQYIGWYDGLPEKCRSITWKIPQDKPVIISEFGADALAGMHGDSLTRWSEEYQEDLYKETLSMLGKIEQLRGISPWILKDFRSPRRQLPGIQDGWNRKGLYSENGGKRKPSTSSNHFMKTGNCNMKKITWGIIGCGDVTERKSGPAYQKTEGFVIGAVMRRDVAKARDYAERHLVPKYYTDADAIINDPEIDAVYIATPPDTHKFYGLKVAAAGKPCCIEKPMATNYADCIALCEAFEAKEIPLFVAYYRRSLPRFLKIKEWIDNNEIGNVRQIRWNLTKPVSEKDLPGIYNWRTDATIAPGGYFDDLACHGIDLFQFLLGAIIEVSGSGSNQLGLYTAKDSIAASWKHASGITGTGNWNFGCSEREDIVEIFGSKGKIIFSVFDEIPIQLIADSIQSLTIPHPENIQLFHVENMRHHLSGKSIHPSSGRTAASTNWVMDKILSDTDSM
ncbi:Gfo/Idh/MocA family oxidoreductase [Flavobacterium sp. 3HN19-14]|uniref:Gfo/Idh/MocA family protein n=1 Tax=Flavobacterium sp. 3HN19-14 TaxID=3448133 RepID=UPI003EDF868A